MSKNNNLKLVGNVGKAPELKVLSSGSELVKFSFATVENFKDKAGEWQKETTWHRCITWNKTATKIMQNAGKGAYLMLEGKIVYNEWVDVNGQKRRDAEMKVNEVYFLNKPKRPDTQPSLIENESMVPADTVIPESSGDDLPF